MYQEFACSLACCYSKSSISPRSEHNVSRPDLMNHIVVIGLYANVDLDSVL